MDGVTDCAREFSANLATRQWQRLLLCCAVALLATCRVAFAQTDEPEIHIPSRSTSDVSSRSDDLSTKAAKPLKANVELVLVPVTVTDPMNRSVLGLEKDNFHIYENKELQTVQYFSSEDAPVSVGVVLDSSGSMASKIDRAREAVLELLISANPNDEFFLVTFSDTPNEVMDFTNSVEDIQSKLPYAFPKGRTALLDALYLAITKMKRAKYSKKALLVISDGGDNHSRYTEHEVTDLVKEADVLVYAIGIYDHSFPTEEERLGPTLLTEVSEGTGGRCFTIDNPGELPETAGRIGAELRNQYVLGYRPNNAVHDGKWHKIKVKLVLPKGLPPLMTHAKQGYYRSAE